MATWIPLIEFSALPEGRGRRICASGLDLAVFRLGDAVYAIDDSCPHAGASLSSGRLQGASVTCRAHGLRFRLEHGCGESPAALQPATYSVRTVDGMVMLDAARPPTDPKTD
jgi:3-phenylpropionate/trans-cinnamate dioxygenase ferredoxin subunit